MSKLLTLATAYLSLIIYAVLCALGANLYNILPMVLIAVGVYFVHMERKKGVLYLAIIFVVLGVYNIISAVLASQLLLLRDKCDSQTDDICKLNRSTLVAFIAIYSGMAVVDLIGAFVAARFQHGLQPPSKTVA
ncbi:hypothetical protein EDD86DRAFT_250285 [Gorgonomyces haynaldii]|nr:hypothetical protein EDD86DRAFT_250285 [Gorgonomyces haynaldii]